MILKVFCISILLLLINFEYAQGGLEIMPHGGAYWDAEKPHNEIVPPERQIAEDNKFTWTLGADVIYRIPLSSINNERWGVGLRYQYHALGKKVIKSETALQTPEEAITEDDVEAREATTEPIDITNEIIEQRVAVLINYRFVNQNQFFLGGLVLLDLWRSIHFRADCEDIPDGACLEDDTIHEWIVKDGVRVQLGLEAGIKFSHALIKSEIGYDVKFKAPYGLIGIGISFL